LHQHHSEGLKKQAEATTFKKQLSSSRALSTKVRLQAIAAVGSEQDYKVPDKPCISRLVVTIAAVWQAKLSRESRMADTAAVCCHLAMQAAHKMMRVTLLATFMVACCVVAGV
jgi:hypothetical protein